MKEPIPPVTDESLDDSLIARRQNEVKELKDEINKIQSKCDSLTEDNTRLQHEMQTLEGIIEVLQSKLLIYEHDPIILQSVDDGYAINYWDDDVNHYKTFALFFNNNLESDLEEFCQEFILELKDAYLVDN